ncbi:hypothetical protein PMI36_00611 [Pseudomonas sp. GM79]|uniref:DUF2247 family protein n=1 Tax=unclassified Pseudomonas TaxID=196821 RepID=UPI00026FA72F|nr:DUF2247 family protein [Pseudomonas sp. GM79]EJN27339.1 hypothetical protein PMI36_00611 [Pseudomonas sp. GM79]
MDPLKCLISLGLMEWSTILLGFGKGWVGREDIIEYALSQLLNGSESEDVAVLAGGMCLSDEELLGLASKQIKISDDVADMDKWRLAFLLCIDLSGDSDEHKIDRLQEAYADFGYPEDMALCSIYSQGNACPLVVMREVVEKLKAQFFID